MQGRLVGGLDLDDVACAAGGVVEDVFVALDYVEVVVGDGLHVETPAGVAASAEGVVDHVADGGDAHLAHAVEGAGTHGEELVGPEEVGLFRLCDLKQVAVEPGDGRAGGEAVGDFVDDGVRGVVVEGVQGNDLVAETLQGPEAIEGRVVEREGRGVQDLHLNRCLRRCLREAEDNLISPRPG